MKIAIVYNHTGKITSIYSAEQPSQESFGGPFADPKMYSHIEIPQELENELPESLEPFMGEKQVGTNMIHVGEEPAYDSNKKPIKGLLGASVMVPVYEEQPIYETTKMIRKKQ